MPLIGPIGPLSAVGPYSASVTSDSPVSYWRLAEPSGTTAADAVGANTGTYTGSPTLGATSPLTNETSDKAVTLSGSGQYVNVPYAAALMPNGSGSFTLEAWVKLSALNCCVVGTYDGANGCNFSIDASGHLSLNTPVGANPSTGVVATGVWTHVAVTYDGTTARFYINGVAAGTATVAHWTTSTTAAFRIGARFDTGGSAVNGSVDEVAKYSTALSAASLLAHYTSATAVFWPVPRSIAWASVNRAASF